MIFLFIILQIILTYQTAEGLVNPAPIVFGEIGKNVTIHSRVKEITPYFTGIHWYRVRPSGQVERVAYFSDYAEKSGRYGGRLPTDSDACLNIYGATIGDSGRNFATVHSDQSFKLGSSSALAVIDPKVLPVMRVFLSHTGAVLCELKGGGPHWSDPQWEKGPKLLQPKAETFIDEQGEFIRSSILSFKDGVRGLNCMCQHSTGVIIRTRVMQESKGQCQPLQYLSPLTAVLLLVTVTVSGLWAWRQWKLNTGNAQQ